MENANLILILHSSSCFTCADHKAGGFKTGVIHFCCRILLLSVFCCSETWALSALFLQSSHLLSWVSIVSTVTFDAAHPYDLPPQASMVIKRTVQAGASSVAAAAHIMTWVFSFHALPGLLLETCKIITYIQLHRSEIFKNIATDCSEIVSENWPNHPTSSSLICT